MLPEETIIQEAPNNQVPLDIDKWLSDSDIEQDDLKEKVPSIFQSSQVDMSILDEEINKEKDTQEESRKVLEAIINPKPESEETPEKEIPIAEETSKGRPKLIKDGLVSFFKEQIEGGDMVTFDDYDDSKQNLDEYLSSLSEKDLKDLYKANKDKEVQKLSQEIPQRFFESLPEEFQQAFRYFQDGGRDIKGVLEALSKAHNTQSMDLAESAEDIAYQYLQATNFGTDEEIKEQIEEWKELESLSKKSEKFKPKLEQLQQEKVNTMLLRQEAQRKQQEQIAQTYVGNVFEALRPGEIAGIKLDRKTQADLYNGLTQVGYPSISGGQTNLLSHLIEKYQFVEPNPALVAEALWLLADPETYRNKIRTQGGTAQTEKIVRELKTEQSRKDSTTLPPEQESKKIARPKNIFQR